MEKENDVFGVFNQSLEPTIKKSALEGIYELDVKELLGGSLKEEVYSKYLLKFLRPIARQAASRALVESNLLGGR